MGEGARAPEQPADIGEAGAPGHPPPPPPCASPTPSGRGPRPRAAPASAHHPGGPGGPPAPGARALPGPGRDEEAARARLPRLEVLLWQGPHPRGDLVADVVTHEAGIARGHAGGLGPRVARRVDVYLEALPVGHRAAQLLLHAAAHPVLPRLAGEELLSDVRVLPPPLAPVGEALPGLRQHGAVLPAHPDARRRSPRAAP